MKLLIALLISSSAFGATYRHHGKYLLPDAKVTPGVVRTQDASQICAKTFRTGPYRKTTAKMKKDVCREYHAADCPGPKWEVDHLIPLTDGGADAISNLWPQPITQARKKDRLEVFEHRAVCTGKMTLPAAQLCIEKDWVGCAVNVGMMK